MQNAIDKSKELKCSISLINKKLNFIGHVDNNPEISIDYSPPLGDNLGYTSLELFLLSLTSCLGSSVLSLLRKMQKTILNCDISALGIRRNEHPTGFKSISIQINIKSPDIKDEDILKAITLSEEKYCPILGMLNENVEIDIKYCISQTQS